MPFSFLNRSKSGITDQQRLTVLHLAVDEDFSLFELASKFPDLATAQAVVADLFDRKMLELFWKQPKGGREPIPPSDTGSIMADDNEWTRKPSFQETYVIAVANDEGWRWYQKHWKSD